MHARRVPSIDDAWFQTIRTKAMHGEQFMVPNDSHLQMCVQVA
jgi:hypothetical protein